MQIYEKYEGEHPQEDQLEFDQQKKAEALRIMNSNKPQFEKDKAKKEFERLSEDIIKRTILILNSK